MKSSKSRKSSPKGRALLISLFLVITLFSSFVPSFARASREVSDLVDVSITVDPDGPVDADSFLKINITFKAPNNDPDPEKHIQGGDTLTFTWGSETDGVKFDSNTKSSIDLIDPNTGNHLATAEITDTGATITFTDGVESLNNIEGALEVTGYARNRNDEGSSNGKITIKLNGKAEKEIEVKPGGGYIQSDEIFKKSGFAQVIEDEPFFTWTLMLNGEYKEDFTSKVTVTDTVAGKGHEFVTDDRIVKVLYARVTDKNDQKVTDHIELNGKDVFDYRKTKGYYYGASNVAEAWANHNDKFVVDFNGNPDLRDVMDISFTDDNSVMTIEVPKEFINGKYIEIIYYTTPIVITDDNIYENSAIMEWDDSTGTNQTTEWSDDFEYYDSTGKISGIPNGTFQIVKYEEGTNTPIEGVKFEIRREDGNPFKDGDLKKEVTTDAKGEASVTNLLPGTYIVTELSAPDIYIVSSEEYKFVMESAGQSHTFYNAKKEEPPEEPPETPAPETIDISVEKKWDDWNNLEGKRPTSVTIKLLADGKDAGADPLVLNKDSGWKGSFADLPKMDGDKEITYTIEEAQVDFYIPTITGDATEGFVVENMSRPWIPKIPSTPGKYGKVTIVKTSSGDVEKDKEFEFIAKVTFESGDVTETPFKLKVDNSYTMDLIPEGAKVEITEQNAEGYTVTYKVDGKEGNTCVVGGESTVTIIVNNDKPSEPPKEEPPKTEPPKEEPPKTETPKKEVPATGDTNNIMLWVLLGATAAFVATLTLRIRIKR